MGEQPHFYLEGSKWVFRWCTLLCFVGNCHDVLDASEVTAVVVSQLFIGVYSVLFSEHGNQV